MERKGVERYSSYHRGRKLAELERRDGTKGANDKRADVVLNLHFVALRPFQRD